MIETLRFCGDVWLPTTFDAMIPSSFGDGLVINLEGPITARGAAAQGKTCLATDEQRFVAAFPQLPVAACLANNHIMDFGGQGFEDTLASLRAKDIMYFGGGTLKERCNNPLVLDVAGSRVALMGYVCPSTHPIWATQASAGVAPIDVDRIKQDLTIAKACGAQHFVVCLHWGDEQVPLPKPGDVRMAAEILGLGVDMIVGSHAHCRQPVLSAEGAHVFFGLGNALFPSFIRYSNEKVSVRSHQRWWNHETTFAQFSPVAGVSWHTLHFRRNALRPSRPWIGRQRVWRQMPAGVALQRYATKYVKARRHYLLRHAVSRYLARPRWPKLTTLLAVVRNVYGQPTDESGSAGT